MHEEVFLSLVRAGLWEGDVKVSGERLAVSGSDVMRLAEEQSVIGLVAAGLEWLTAYSLPLTEKLTLLGKCQLIEQRNVAMNQFVVGLIARMREADINALLMKGQGLAQCYERPMWRACGDVDLFLDDDNKTVSTALGLACGQGGTLFETPGDDHRHLDSGTARVSSLRTIEAG